MPDRDPLLEDLAAGWASWDPMPAGLPDRILTAIAMDGLDADYELLTLVSRSEHLLGVRANDNDRTLIEFSADGVAVLVRVATTASGRRLDGWVDPGPLAAVTLTLDGYTHAARVTSGSRFEVDGLPSGLAQLELDLVADGATRRFRSPHFEI